MEVRTRLLYFTLAALGFATIIAGIYFFTRGEGATRSPAAQPKYTVSDRPLYASTENRRVVTVFFPATDGLHLVATEREIYATSSVSAQMKQLVVELIKGPSESDQSGIVKALPEATRLREIYIHRDTAYVDFTKEVVDQLEGGSHAELLTVYSVVDSVIHNFPEITRVKILVDGADVDSLGGHLDLSLPLLKDMGFVRSPQPGA